MLVISCLQMVPVVTERSYWLKYIHVECGVNEIEWGMIIVIR